MDKYNRIRKMQKHEVKKHNIIIKWECGETYRSVVPTEKRNIGNIAIYCKIGPIASFATTVRTRNKIRCRETTTRKQRQIVRKCSSSCPTNRMRLTCVCLPHSRQPPFYLASLMRKHLTCRDILKVG